ncbi:MAG TPA: hypothetical protein VHU13_06155 [Solirubrobacteraceae bacterium]|jgi:membrane associated rhomboid family serine protease|nr:hypothetical protein [Solirubrobacteraceae bacterium]
MLPFKDNLPHERAPLVVLALVAANVLAWAMPARPLPLGATLLDLAALALVGASVESRLGHLRLLGLCILGGALAFALASPAAAAAGASAAIVLGYLVLFPRARVLSLVLVPFLVTIVEVPAALLLGAWTGAQLYLRLTA